MSEKSNIAWTDASWNPVTGCSHVSEGCRNCYAETLSLRFGWSKKPWTAQNAAENVVLHPDRLEAPLHWRKPRRIFVNSMSDLFHEEVPQDFIASVFVVMERARHHTFQILTKRAERMREAVSLPHRDSRWPLPNIWLGLSCEDQATADQRIPLLLDTPAAVRFVSCEPLLAPIDLTRIVLPNDGYAHRFPPEVDALNRAHVDGLGFERGIKQGLDWVIVGGESGPGFRPMSLDWARSIREQCRAAGVAYFGKQNSGPRPGIPLPGDLGDQEFPA